VRTTCFTHTADTLLARLAVANKERLRHPNQRQKNTRKTSNQGRVHINPLCVLEPTRALPHLVPNYVEHIVGPSKEVRHVQLAGCKAQWLVRTAATNNHKKTYLLTHLAVSSPTLEQDPAFTCSTGAIITPTLGLLPMRVQRRSSQPASTHRETFTPPRPLLSLCMLFMCHFACETSEIFSPIPIALTARRPLVLFFLNKESAADLPQTSKHFRTFCAESKAFRTVWHLGATCSGAP
jgi:hypothetical protein